MLCDEIDNLSSCDFFSISHNVGYRDYKLSKSAIFVKFTGKK